MSALSPVVIAAALLVSSPALWNAFVVGTTSMSEALTKFLVALVACWAALGLVAELVGPAVPRQDRPDAAAPAAPEEAPAASPS